MRRYLIMLVIFLILGSEFSVSSCKVCHGDDQGDSNDAAHCDGNLLKDTSDDDSDTDNDILDLISNRSNIQYPNSTTISNGDKTFKMFVTEVTNTQYASFLKEKSAKASESGDGNSNDCHLDNGKVALCYQFTGEGTSAKNSDNEDVKGGKARILEASYSVSPDNAGSHPVTYVSWYAAKEFCAAIGWRLPTENEWTAAAGDSDYPWGEADPTCDLANFASEDKDHGFCEGDTVDVASGEGSTAEGVRHLAGNVFEWTNTQVADDDKEENQRDRIVKGGAWDSSESALKIEEKKFLLPTSTLANVGFRCVD
ncbi:MAG: SUMF1/EgtB/PvdO family nonheme iron enzyme [SAR324 cluster bacterium]|nr:SUMF1/EgtB/PvdO family nonheme iron enzyme [SAR324 cluster bacterium]